MAAKAATAAGVGGPGLLGGVIRAGLAPLLALVAGLRARVRELTAKLRAEREARKRAEAERDRLRRGIERQQREVDRLKAELEEARRAAKRQAAPFARTRRRPKSEHRRPGRKPGHPAANRPAPERVDEEIKVPLQACPDCGGGVEDVHDLAPQIVIDLPRVLELLVRRFHMQSGWCSACKKRVRSRHPEQCSQANGAAGVQLGPRLASLAVDLKHRVGVTFRKVAGLFDLLFRLHVSAGALVRAERRITARCEPSYQALIETVRRAPVVGIDETGWYITGAQKKPWLWVFTSRAPPVTLFVIRQSRGGDVPEAILGDEFTGAIGIDGWAGYDCLDCRKGQCNGHFLRRCRELLEVQKQGAARFPHAVERLILDAIGAKESAWALAPQDRTAVAEQFRGQLAALLDGQVSEPANRRFARHLLRHESEVFTFLEVPGLEPTNNDSEREIRPAVVIRKISAGNRSEDGAHAHEVLASLGRTAERNGLRLPELLPALLCSPEPLVLPIVTPQPGGLSWRSSTSSAQSTFAKPPAAPTTSVQSRSSPPSSAWCPPARSTAMATSPSC